MLFYGLFAVYFPLSLVAWSILTGVWAPIATIYAVMLFLPNMLSLVLSDNLRWPIVVAIVAQSIIVIGSVIWTLHWTGLLSSVFTTPAGIVELGNPPDPAAKATWAIVQWLAPLAVLNVIAISIGVSRRRRHRT